MPKTWNEVIDVAVWLAASWTLRPGMVNNFYTLRALVNEWQPELSACTLRDVFSQVRNELTLAFQGEGQGWMLRVSVQAPFLFIFRTEGISKKKRNVATLFEDALGRRVDEVRIARRDRMLFIDLDDGRCIQFTLFGHRANVYLVTGEGVIQAAFRSGSEHAGQPAPTPRAAPHPDTPEAFEKRWRSDRRRADQAVSAAVPIFDRTLATEALHRAGVDADRPEDCSQEDRSAIFEAVQEMCKVLKQPAPRIYWQDRTPDTLSLLPLHHRGDEENAEIFETVDDAVRIFVRSRLAREHFRRLYEPLEEALSEARDHYRQSVEHLQSELAGSSRADRYEHWGHLLMASPADVPDGAEEVTLPDLFGSSEPVKIPLDPALSAIENAERYYEKARRTRRSREEAEKRLDRTRAQADEAEDLLNELRDIERLSDLKKFRKREEERLAPFLGEQDEDISSFPFRRFRLGDGYEVWVGRNARQNDELTFHRAQKYDLWMHARGVPGAHAVLRLPNRDAEPGRRLLHQAAAIAAHFSKARGSSAAPVMIARRKHVRKPSGAAPGAVRVEHEDVVMVEPGLP